MFVVGPLKLVWFRTSTASRRNSNSLLSVILIRLMRSMSKPNSLGAITKGAGGSPRLDLILNRAVPDSPLDTDARLVIDFNPLKTTLRKHEARILGQSG